MKQKMSKALLLFPAVILFSVFMVSCKAKVKDADVETSVTSELRNNPEFTAVSVSVKDGVATLSGEVKDEATKSAAASEAKSVKGVSSVNNNITVAAPVTTAPVEITADDPLNALAKDAVKDHAGVVASVNDGVVTLTGEINKADLPKLMQKINALKPRKVENKLVIK